MHGPCMEMALIKVFGAAELLKGEFDVVQEDNSKEKRYTHNISTNIYSVFMGAMNKWDCGLEGLSFAKE